MSDYYHIRATREQLSYVDGLVRQGLSARLGKGGKTFSEAGLFSGLLGETLVKDLFGFMRSSYRVADHGVDFTLEGVKIDVKTTGYNPTVNSLDRIVLIKKEWLDHHAIDKNTDVLLFTGHDKHSNVLHFLGWVAVRELK